MQWVTITQTFILKAHVKCWCGQCQKKVLPIHVFFMYIMSLNFKPSVTIFTAFRFFQEQMRCLSTLATGVRICRHKWINVMSCVCGWRTSTRRNLRKSSFTSTQVELDALFFKVGSVAGHAGLELLPKLSPIYIQPSLPSPQSAYHGFCIQMFSCCYIDREAGILVHILSFWH